MTGKSGGRGVMMFEGTGALVRVERLGNVAVVVLDAAPDNRLTMALRAALLAALEQAMDDTEVAAVVILGEGSVFASGAGAEDGRPAPGDLALRIEEAPRPVVVALHGAVEDEALELALAARARVAEAGAMFGFGYAAVGLVPGGGGTQRLPRRVGVGPALEMLTTGRRVGAAEALAVGLVDRVVEGQDALLEAALALAEDLARQPGPRPGWREVAVPDLPVALAAVAAARVAATGATLVAARRIVDCVEAALVLPFAQGLDFEAAARADVADLSEVAALQALARAEARTAPGFAEVAVAGSIPVAVACLAGGMAVTLVRPDRTGLIAALEMIAASQGLAVESGRLTEARREADWARLTPALEAPAGMPLIEAGEMGVTVRVGDERSEVTLHEGLAEVRTPAAASLFRSAGLMAVVTRGPVLAPMRAALAAVATHEAARAGRAAVEAELAGFGVAVEGLPAGGSAPPGPLEARLLAVLANRGLALIGEGVVDRPSDIDAALVHGAGWLRHVPGPMLWAARRGLLVLRADLNRWKDEAPALWEPAPLIAAMLRRGTRLDALER
jgi:3-hydroxyacyl-CoA dehydrogenase